MIRISAQTYKRTVDDMYDMFKWSCDTFGKPTEDRWVYGRNEHEGDYLGYGFINGPWEIEWYDFQHEKDATLFRLRWP